MPEEKAPELLLSKPYGTWTITATNRKEFATRTPQSTVCFLDLLNPSSLLLKILDSATGAKPREQPVSMCGGSTSPHMST